MKLFKNLNKGFTLVEVIMALGIFTIVLGILFPFFLSNYKTINNTSIKSNLQWEAENIMQYVSKSFMEGNSIENIKNIKDNDVEYVKIKLDNDNYYSFKLEGSKLIYESSEKPIKKVIGENVYKFQVIPDNIESENPENITGVDIKIILKKKDIEYTIKDHIFLRNSN